MSISILEAGLTAEFSEEITVGECEYSLLSAYNPDGLNIPAGPVLVVQRKDINGNFITLSTAIFGSIYISSNSQQVTISMPGTYRVSRPDISAWGFEIGVSAGTGG